jgi:hypothetical protein
MCDICNRSYSSKSFKRHRNRHALRVSGAVKCTQCYDTYNNTESLKQHMDAMHVSYITILIIWCFSQKLVQSQLSTMYQLDPVRKHLLTMIIYYHRL